MDGKILESMWMGKNFNVRVVDFEFFFILVIKNVCNFKILKILRY